ncbi:MAG TPA: DUF2238 domain-containing protein, partial [Nitriliruptorales bacterium]|nr:DUF2238 domain-containing protein [Nitriliruptorales bacterium]
SRVAPRRGVRRDRVTHELRSNLGLLTLTAIGTTAGIGLGIATGRQNWPVYLWVIVVGVVLAVWLHIRYRFSRATRVGLTIFALAHVAGGMVPVADGVLYRQWLVEPLVRYDNLQHAWGFGFAGRAVWEMLRGRLGAAARDPLVTWWLVVLAAAAVGAVNEVVEWVLTLTIPGTDVGGYDNTARDLVADLVGGAAVGSWTARASRTG